MNRNVIGFNSFQVSELTSIIEEYDIQLNLNDSEAGGMFSKLLIVSARMLNGEQEKAFWNKV